MTERLIELKFVRVCIELKQQKNKFENTIPRKQGEKVSFLFFSYRKYHEVKKKIIPCIVRL